MRRIVGLDAIRAVAILLIVACHICYGVNAMSPVGQYLGGTYNFVFFLAFCHLIGIDPPTYWRRKSLDLL